MINWGYLCDICETYLGIVRSTVVIILITTGRGADPGALILELAYKVEGGVRLGQGEGASDILVAVHLEELPVRGASWESCLVLGGSHARNSYFDFEKNQVYLQFPVHNVGGLRDDTCARLRVSNPTEAGISGLSASFDLRQPGPRRAASAGVKLPPGPGG